MKKCPVYGIELSDPLPPFCSQPGCGWDLKTDLTLNPSFAIPDNILAEYKTRISIARTNWRGRQELEDRVRKLEQEKTLSATTRRTPSPIDEAFINQIPGRSHRLFVDHGDGTMTSIQTGLMWQKAHDIKRRNWIEACEHARNLGFAGYHNWRLPTKEELENIIGPIRSSSSSSAFFRHGTSDECWSESRYSNFDTAWYLDFSSGFLHWAYIDREFYVRCVRDA